MPAPVTVPAVRGRKVRDGAQPLVMVTAYDAPGARLVADGGADLLLVGDSVAMVVLGYDDTLQVTVEDLAHHTAAVARGLRSWQPDPDLGDVAEVEARSSSPTCRGSATTCRSRTPSATPPP